MYVYLGKETRGGGGGGVDVPGSFSSSFSSSSVWNCSMNLREIGLDHMTE